MRFLLLALLLLVCISVGEANDAVLSDGQLFDGAPASEAPAVEDTEEATTTSAAVTGEENLPQEDDDAEAAEARRLADALVAEDDAKDVDNSLQPVTVTAKRRKVRQLSLPFPVSPMLAAPRLQLKVAAPLHKKLFPNAFEERLQQPFGTSAGEKLKSMSAEFGKGFNVLEETEHQHQRERQVRMEIQSLSRSDDDLVEVPWGMKLNLTEVSDGLEKVFRSSSLSERSLMMRVRLVIFKKLKRVVYYVNAFKQCSNYYDCKEYRDGLYQVQWHLTKALEKQVSFLRKVMKVTRSRADVLVGNFAEFKEKGDKFRGSLANPFVKPYLGIIGIFFGVMFMTYFAVLVVLGKCFFKIQGPGQGYLVVSFGLCLGSVCRILRGIFGLLGTVVTYSLCNPGDCSDTRMPTGVPIAIGSLSPVIMNISLWYFLYLWGGAYVETYADEKYAIVKKLLGYVLVPCAILIPLSVMENLLFFMPTSPYRGQFPNFMAVTTYCFIFLAQLGLIFFCVAFLRRFKNSTNPTSNEQQYKASVIRMLVILILLACGTLVGITLQLHAQFGPINESLVLRTHSSGAAKVAVELPLALGLAIILGGMIFGHRCSACFEMIRKRNGYVPVAGEYDSHRMSTQSLLMEEQSQDDDDYNMMMVDGEQRRIPAAYDV